MSASAVDKILSEDGENGNFVTTLKRGAVDVEVAYDGTTISHGVATRGLEALGLDQGVLSELFPRRNWLDTRIDFHIEDATVSIAWRPIFIEKYIRVGSIEGDAASVGVQIASVGLSIKLVLEMMDSEDSAPYHIRIEDVEKSGFSIEAAAPNTRTAYPHYVTIDFIKKEVRVDFTGSTSQLDDDL